MADDGWLDPSTNPAVAGLIEDVLKDDYIPPTAPVSGGLPDSFVKLPAGIEVDGKKVTEVEVQELTGESEEKLSKARQSSDPTRFYNLLLEEGIVDIGGQPASAILPQLLVGDREVLMLGIRKATYGADIDLRVYCPECGEWFDGAVSTDDISIRPFDSDMSFEVKLRKGGKAWVHLATGADQTAYMSDPGITDAERNSLLLSRCVEWVEDATGNKNAVAAFYSLIREMGVLDRRSILRELDNRQPGPRYDGLETEHEECGTVIPVQFGMDALFPGL